MSEFLEFFSTGNIWIFLNTSKTIFIAGLTLDVIGKILVAYAALSVHHRFWREHRVDDFVFKAMKREQIMGMGGIILIITGFFAQVIWLL